MRTRPANNKLIKAIGFAVLFLLISTPAALYYSKYYKERKEIPDFAVPVEHIQYQFQNEQLQVSYDNGSHWRTVPVSFEDLFFGEYNGSKQELIEGSYMINPERTAFVVGDETGLRLIQSEDRGKTWTEADVPSPIPRVRLRLLGFTSEKNGYLILTGDRAMSFEANAILKTNDGGKSWYQAGSVQATNTLLTDGGFVNDRLGFISFGTFSALDHPDRPFLFRTADGGRNWSEVPVQIPAEYQGIFTIAEVPAFDGNQGTLLVNQGPNGDFQGGKVLAKFISADEGATWSFTGIVDREGNALED
ncbi:WD40/YVTN/BNR-like repeat-containing protein [Bacillus sp. T33-2]|uniref:WD40/YVTN/BNR-like repeat-containing protein n=1 Tax=Bacillus sp. T33-2 TaxID=2054168 RepID=UPI000C779BD8|nr:sialidase family protein [Bacillus sp. T33-2]PLR96509.1 oxidoreductase [Bacillus sp. T33-2]